MDYQEGDKLVFKPYEERPACGEYLSIHDYRQPYPGHAPSGRFEPYKEYKIIWAISGAVYVSNYNCPFTIKNGYGGAYDKIENDPHYIEKWFYTPKEIRKLKLEKLKTKY